MNPSTSGPVKRVLLYSPIPPTKSGTADYFSAFMQEAGLLLTRFDCKIVYDPAEAAKMPEKFHGFECVPADRVLPAPDDLTFIFLANNEFHHFCIARLDKPKCGRSIALIHDPQMFMNVANLCVSRGAIYQGNDVERFVGPQFGFKSSQLMTAVLEGTVPQVIWYTTLAQGSTLAKADEIWVHSHYARLKLLLETDPEVRIPPIQVVHHPVLNKTIPLPAWEGGFGKKEKFVAGCFGWVAPSKRTNQAIEAFALFVESLAPAERDWVQLKVVGQLPPVEYYDPKSTVAKRQVESFVEFKNYVPIEEFESEMQKCSIIFNLRFPSCGETSGTLQRARDLGIPVAVSAYQSFHEEAADFKCSIHPEAEITDIAQVLRVCFEEWKTRGHTRGLIKKDEIELVKQPISNALALTLHSLEYSL